MGARTRPRRKARRVAITVAATFVAPSLACGDPPPENEIVVPVTERIAYGSDPSQFADLTRPDDVGNAPVVVLVHGGFWRSLYALDLMERLASDLVARGYAVWNVEYRRVGQPGGGWPGTAEDVAAAVDHVAAIAAEHSLDLSRVGIVGHSAGGHLALWVAGRAALPAGAPGANPTVIPVIAVGQGAVADLRAGADAGLGSGAVTAFLGGAPDALGEQYDLATPRLAAGVRVVSVRGTDDDVVPARFTVPPGGADRVTVIDVAGADHFDLIDPASSAWTAVVEELDASLR